MLKIPKRPPRYVELSTGAIIRAALSDAVKSGRPARVIGPSGVGKSGAVADLIVKHDAIGCEITAKDKTIAGIYKLILELLEVRHFAQTTNDLSEEVYSTHVRRLADGAVIVLDEYQNIQPFALRELLAVQELLGLSLLLVGNGSTIIDRKKVMEERAFSQIQNRFGMQVEVPMLLDVDFDRLADEWSVEEVEATRKMVALYGRSFSLHQLIDLLTGAREASVVGPVRMQHLHDQVARRNPARLPYLAQPQRAKKAKASAANG